MNLYVRDQDIAPYLPARLDSIKTLNLYNLTQDDLETKIYKYASLEYLSVSSKNKLLPDEKILQLSRLKYLNFPMSLNQEYIKILSGLKGLTCLNISKIESPELLTELKSLSELNVYKEGDKVKRDNMRRMYPNLKIYFWDLK